MSNSVNKNSEKNKEFIKKSVNNEIKSTVKRVSVKKEFQYYHILAFLCPPLGLILYLLWRNKKEETAKKIGTMTLISSIICLFVAFSFMVSSTKEKVKEALSSIDTWVEDIKGDESVVTVLASSTCPHCKNLRPVITASSNNLGYKLYFFEGDTLSESDYKLLTETIELEGYEGYVPYTFVVKNMEFMGAHTGEMQNDELTEFLKETMVLN